MIDISSAVYFSFFVGFKNAQNKDLKLIWETENNRRQIKFVSQNAQFFKLLSIKSICCFILFVFTGNGFLEINYRAKLKSSDGEQSIMLKSRGQKRSVCVFRENEIERFLIYYQA